MLKAGALAWTVPVVAVATAAPAYATSGSNMSTSTGTASYEILYLIFPVVRVPLVITNSGSGPTTALTVTITIPSGLRNLSSQEDWVPVGWTATSVDTANDVIVFTAGSQLAAGATTTVSFDVRRSLFVASGNVTIAISPGGGGVGKTIVDPV